MDCAEEGSMTSNVKSLLIALVIWDYVEVQDTHRRPVRWFGDHWTVDRWELGAYKGYEYPGEVRGGRIMSHETAVIVHRLIQIVGWAHIQLDK